MRILLLTPIPPDADAPGAIPAVLYATLVGLSERHEVTVVTSPGPDVAEFAAVDALRLDGYDVRSVPRHTARGMGRWTRRARMASSWLSGRSPWRTTWFHEPRLQAVIDDLLAGDCFDVVAVEDNAMASFRLESRAAVVLTEHEVRRARSVDWRAGLPRDWPAWAFREADWHRWPPYQRSVWRRFDAIQVFTARDAQGLVDLSPELRDRVHVNPFGITLVDLSRPVPEDPNAVCFVGNFSHPPNVDAALWLARGVLPRVRARVRDARLRIAGADAPAEVRALASSHVQIVGYQHDVTEFIRQAAVVAAPVRIGGGMRMKVLQGMALGRPVVTTTRGIDGLDCYPGAPLLVADDAEGLAVAIARLLSDDEQRGRLGTQARAYVDEHFSPTAYARRLETVYEAAIATRRRTGP
jgi:glycosyltransferase involved in cell wall biosynthesis